MAAIGWDKDKIKKQLAEELFYLLGEVKHRSGVQRASRENGVDMETLQDRFSLYTDPQRIRLVVAGGDHPSRAMWIPNLVVEGNEEIELPRNWNDLLKQAARELGPPQTDY